MCLSRQIISMRRHPTGTATSFMNTVKSVIPQNGQPLNIPSDTNGTAIKQKVKAKGKKMIQVSAETQTAGKNF